MFREKEFLFSQKETIARLTKLDQIAAQLNNKAFANAITAALPGNPQILFE